MYSYFYSKNKNYFEHSQRPFPLVGLLPTSFIINSFIGLKRLISFFGYTSSSAFIHDKSTFACFAVFVLICLGTVCIGGAFVTALYTSFVFCIASRHAFRTVQKMTFAVVWDTRHGTHRCAHVSGPTAARSLCYQLTDTARIRSYAAS